MPAKRMPPAPPAKAPDPYAHVATPEKQRPLPPAHQRVAGPRYVHAFICERCLGNPFAVESDDERVLPPPLCQHCGTPGVFQSSFDRRPDARP